MISTHCDVCGDVVDTNGFRIAIRQHDKVSLKGGGDDELSAYVDVELDVLEDDDGDGIGVRKFDLCASCTSAVAIRSLLYGLTDLAVEKELPSGKEGSKAGRKGYHRNAERPPLERKMRPPASMRSKKRVSAAKIKAARIAKREG